MLPTGQFGLTIHCVAAWEAGRSEEAIEVLIPLQTAVGDNTVSEAELRQALAAGGRPALARLLVAKLPRRAFFPYFYATLGEGDLAIRELERLYAEHDAGLPMVVRSRSIVDLVGTDPRFLALLRRMGLEP